MMLGFVGPVITSLGKKELFPLLYGFGCFQFPFTVRHSLFTRPLVVSGPCHRLCYFVF